MHRCYLGLFRDVKSILMTRRPVPDVFLSLCAGETLGEEPGEEDESERYR